MFWNPFKKKPKLDPQALARDPEAWQKLARDPAVLRELDDNQLSAVFLSSAFHYGRSNDESLAAQLGTLYIVCRERIAKSHREKLLEVVSSGTARGHLSANALLPFLFRETDTSLVCRASIEYAAARHTPHDDTLAGVRDLIGMFRSGQPENRAGIFAGLLLLGDRRVTALLDAHRRELTAAEIRDVAEQDTGFVHAPVIEFYLDWLAELLDSNNSDAAFLVAQLLQDAASGGTLNDRILEERRAFPISPGGTCTVERLKAFTPAEYAKIVLPKLRRMAEQNNGAFLRRTVQAWIGATK
jgi:hypothetical protein